MKRRFLLGGIIIFLAVGYLGYMVYKGSTSYFDSVSALIEQGDLIYDQNVQVNGQVAPGSVEQEPGGFILRFTITDEERSLPVVYEGIVPNSFKVGGDIIVEGTLDSSGTFQANTLMPKCPSKYVPEL